MFTAAKLTALARTPSEVEATFQRDDSAPGHICVHRPSGPENIKKNLSSAAEASFQPVRDQVKLG